jgi:hypothetical protein
VQQVLALEINFRAAEKLRPTLREIERRGPADVMREQAVEFRLKRGILPGALIFRRQFLQGRHECFRHEHAAIGPEMTVGIRERGEGRGGGHERTIKHKSATAQARILGTAPPKARRGSGSA